MLGMIVYRLHDAQVGTDQGTANILTIRFFVVYRGLEATQAEMRHLFDQENP
jgi:hypothetical protein